MNNEASFQGHTADTSLFATLVACGSIGLQAVVLGVTADPFSYPGSILGIGANGANLFRWGMILDMFGYYLLLAPLALLLWNRLKPKGMNVKRDTRRPIPVSFKHIGPGTARYLLQALLSQDASSNYNFHKALLRHGQRICIYDRPRCEKCVLTDFCDYYNTVVKPF